MVIMIVLWTEIVFLMSSVLLVDELVGDLEDDELLLMGSERHEFDCGSVDDCECKRSLRGW